MEQMITLDLLQRMNDRFEQSFEGKLSRNAVTRSGLAASAADYAMERRMRYSFSLEVEVGKVTNQKSSGRCWMFAALNTMRFEIMKKLNLETFELSQSYPLFYDKLEKSNYFLENILTSLDAPLDGRLVAFLLQSPVQDGGQWDMFRSLVEKYGVVPKDQMPETFHSSNTGLMNKFLTLKLRQFACELRTAHEEGESLANLRAKKESMLAEIHHMLCVCLGTPPTALSFEVRNKDKAFHRAQMTPVEFFRTYVGWNLADYVSLIHAPTKDKPYERMYTVDRLGSVFGGAYPVRYLNLPAEQLKEAAIRQLQDGHPVWFGCDVGQWLHREWGCMDTAAFDFAGVLGTAFPLTKAQRLDYGESVMTHAMVFAGVNLDENGKPDRWKVENSWGDKSGNEGWYIMSDDWFSEYTYQVVVHKKHLTNRQLELLSQEPIILKPWDPMGSLATVL